MGNYLSNICMSEYKTKGRKMNQMVYGYFVKNIIFYFSNKFIKDVIN
jgi:hypothetical protein